MRIFHVLTSTTYSGAENVVCQIIHMFKENVGVEMFYCSPDGPINDSLREKGVNFVPLKAFNVRELKHVINEYKPDIVHAHDMRAAFVSAKACGKTPLIIHIHNNNYDNRGLTLKSIGFLFPAVKAKHIFYVSGSSYKGYFFHSFFKKKSSVLYNVIDEEGVRKKAEEDMSCYNYDVVFLGRLTLPKNPLRLLSVLKLVVKKDPIIRVAIVGTGDMYNQVKECVVNQGLIDNVFLLGFMSNPLKILKESKVMVMTSKWEGTPMCALEAMSLGVPIVSTPTDGLKDLVDNSITGFLSDDDAVLAEKIVEIIHNQQLYQTLNQGSLQKSAQINNISLYRKSLEEFYGL